MEISGLPSSIQLQILRHLSATKPPQKPVQLNPAKHTASSEATLTACQALTKCGFAVVDDFLAPETADKVLSNLCKPWRSNGKLRPAKTGAGVLRKTDLRVRSDSVAAVDLGEIDSLLDRENLSDGVDAENGSNEGRAVHDSAQPRSVHDQLMVLVHGVNRAFSLPENQELRSNGLAQLGFYSDGAMYVKHKDASPLIPGRLITAIMYFTENWEESQGGQLRLYSDDGSYTDIAPRFNRLLLFKSHLDHEVMPTFCDRFALTIWMYSENADTAAKIRLHSMLPRTKAKQLNELEAAESDKSWSITISVASYRDPDTHATVNSLLQNAKYPQRLKIHILYQDHPEEDSLIHSEPLVSNGASVVSTTIPSHSATGPYSARRTIAKKIPLPPAEDAYYLQIDSHMRFVQDWDTSIIEFLKSAETVCSKSIISFYPPGFGDDNLNPTTGSYLQPPGPHGPVLMYCKGFDADGMPRVAGKLVFPPPPVKTWPDGVSETETLIRQPFVAAGLLFARIVVIQDMYGISEESNATAQVSENLEGLFFGEESLCSARLWTRGWEIWAPRDPEVAIGFHRWNRAYRHTFWENSSSEDVNDGGKEGRDIGKNRCRRLVKRVLELEGSGDAHALDGEWGPGFRNGVGKDRLLADWKVLCGMS
ncbi:Egl nine 3 [Chytriomyces hyalinus]|nr:Egl nine 3 [Chytriomyces hyalinus]